MRSKKELLNFSLVPYHDVIRVSVFIMSSANEVSTGPRCQFLSFRHSFRSTDSGSGTLLIQLGVLNLAEQ